MAEDRKVTVKYYDGSLPRWKGFEDLEIAGEKFKATFVKDGAGKDWLAKDVPLRFALRLHNSEAYDIVGEDGKVPKEFAANASPLSDPKKRLPPAAEKSEVEALRAQVIEMRKQNDELAAALEEAGKENEALEAKYNALVAAQTGKAPAPSAKK